MLPDDLKFTKDHEWIKIEGDEITLGITDYAQGELGDIIFVELPQVGEAFNQGDTVGSIEAVKTVADIYIPVDVYMYMNPPTFRRVREVRALVNTLDSTIAVTGAFTL